MSKTITVDQGSLVLEPRVIKRIHEVHQYVDRMRAERAGWGPDAQQDVTDTVRSFFDGLDTLLSASQVWIDGGTGYSFGGVLPGGIVFGMIARQERPHWVEADGERVEFSNPPLQWTFHS